MDDNDPQLLNKSEQELQMILGAHILGAGLGGKPPSESDKRKAGSSWFEANLGKLRSVLCGNNAIRDYLSGSNKDMADIFSKVFDLLLLSTVFHGWPIGALSALAIRYGLKRICSVQVV